MAFLFIFTIANQIVPTLLASYAMTNGPILGINEQGFYNARIAGNILILFSYPTLILILIFKKNK